MGAQDRALHPPPPKTFREFRSFTYFFERDGASLLMRQGEKTFARLVHFFLLTEKEYSDDLHIKSARGGEFRELPIVKFELRMEGRGIDSRRAQKKTAVQYSCFV